MPEIYDDPAAPERNAQPDNPPPAVPQRGPAFNPVPGSPPLRVFATQSRLNVTQAIRYINQELGFEGLRQVWHRSRANVIVRPTPWAVQQQARRGEAVATSWVTYTPSREGDAQRNTQVIYVDPALESRVQQLYGYDRRPPATQRVGRQRKYGTVSLPPGAGTPYRAAHELGHTLGLTHDPPPDAPLGPNTAYGIMSGGLRDISPYQRELIARLLGIEPNELAQLEAPSTSA